MPHSQDDAPGAPMSRRAMRKARASQERAQSTARPERSDVPRVDPPVEAAVASESAPPEGTTPAQASSLVVGQLFPASEPVPEAVPAGENAPSPSEPVRDEPARGEPARESVRDEPLRETAEREAAAVAETTADEAASATTALRETGRRESDDDDPDVPGFVATGIDAAATERLDLAGLGFSSAPYGDDAARHEPDEATVAVAAAQPLPDPDATQVLAAAVPQTHAEPAVPVTASRASSQPPSKEPPVESSKGGGSRGRGIRIGVLIALAVIVVAALWVGVRALMVKNDLEAVQRVVNHIQDGGTLDVSVPILGEHAKGAASVASDPVWRAAEFLPWAGDNLRGVRLASEALDIVSNDIGTPALAEMAKDTDESIITRVLPLVEGSTADIQRIADGVAALRDTGTLIPEVQTGVNLVDGVMQLAAPALEFGPELLGANGERNYLLVFQNNAESVGLGGSAASQTLMNANEGNLAITNQASSADFTEFENVDVAVDQSALDLYSDYLVHHINTSSSRPDFPTMAEIVTAFWQRDIGDDRIDGVVSIDPIALGYVLSATGPITLDTGEVLAADNAAQMLLSDVYARWPNYEDGPVVDEFFASVAEQVFTKVSTGDFDIQQMLWAVRHGIDGGNILFHSSDEGLQQQLANERVSGILPTANEEETTVGVFFRDESASKIDYYMKSNIDVTQTCEADASQFRVDSTLHLDLDQATAETLPDYVLSGNQDWGQFTFRTQVYVYGPPGTTVTGVEVEGEEVALKRDDVVDLDRPVAWFETYLNPGEIAKVTATFEGTGEFGPLALRSTPMVQQTTGALAGCDG